MMAIVGHLTIDKVVLERGIHYNMGGVACYAALAAKLLKSEVKIISRVGADFPREYLGLLESMKIDLSEVYVDPESKTTSFQLNYLGGGRKLKLLSRAGEITLEEIEGDAIYLGPVAWEITTMDIERLLGRHEMVALDPQGLMRESGEGGDIFLKPVSLKLPNLWILRISKEEAQILSKSDDPNMMLKSLKGTGAKITILTLGAEGALVYDGRKKLKVPSYEVPEVDSTGAGDAFGGAFVAEYLNSKDLELAAAMGSAAASLVVEDIGFRSLISPSAGDEIRRRAWEIYESIIEV
ncbi:MAG: PfkB family carbohydrate kinase [Nitrososphaeria archaeon]|nr:PfkB family carbohydrate kinase [Nitrososphaeria archaeon]